MSSGCPSIPDLDQVKRIIKRIGQELAEHPTCGPSLLEPVKSQGVRRVEETAMIVGVKFMAKPGEQFLLRREVYQRSMDEFEKAGIHFARPQVVVHVPEGGSVGSEAVSAGAARALTASDVATVAS